jgi:organic hydroperoxide reductase OsmC/OhrA
MTVHDIATALQRAKAVFHRRPGAGLHDDAPATACWQGGTRIVSSHANGIRMATDMPAELGGSGDQVTPGWLFRAGLASCLATCIAMAAAEEGIELAILEVIATSRSDARGLLGMTDADGKSVFAGPRDMRLCVRISAPGVPAERMRTLVKNSQSRSPVPNAVRSATPMELHIDIDAA